MSVRIVGPVSGYSTQAGISLDVAELINNRRIRLWFAAEFNPIGNADTSRPLWIFEQLDRTAKTRDAESTKARNTAAKLRAWVALWEANGFIDREAQGRALQAIKTALDDGGFHPLVFHLAGIVGAMKGEEPDEYWVENQSLDDPRVRQILPPKHGGAGGV